MAISISVEVAPTDLRANLLHSAWHLPIALALGFLQLQYLSQDPWWIAALHSAAHTNLIDIAAGMGVGVLLLFAGTVVSVLTRGGDNGWSFKGLASIEPRHRNIWLIASFAAVFEELLFRAALVPLVGPVLAAVIFAAAHYGTLLVAPSKGDAARAFIDVLVFGLVMGWLFEAVGVVACVVAHLVHNIIALYHARPPWQRFHQEWQAANTNDREPERDPG
jgi:hypothetical protein